MNRDDTTILKVLTKMTYLGLFMNVLAPVSLLLIIAFLRDDSIQSGSGLNINEKANLQACFFIFLFVSAVDFVLAYLVRRKLPTVILKSQEKTLAERFERSALNISIILFSLNASMTVYGLILALLGAGNEAMMFFVALTFIGYQFFRPRQAFLERMWDLVHETHQQQAT